ncbi:MAG: STAS domain-containing protein [bacterium]
MIFEKSTIGVFHVLKPTLEENELFDSERLQEEILSSKEENRLNIAVDLAETNYLYSDAINVMVTCNKAMLKISGRLAVYNANEKVGAILERAGLANIINIYTDEKELLEASDVILKQTSTITASREPQTTVPEKPKSEFDLLREEIGEVMPETFEGTPESLSPPPSPGKPIIKKKIKEVPHVIPPAPDDTYSLQEQQLPEIPKPQQAAPPPKPQPKPPKSPETQKPPAKLRETGDAAFEVSPAVEVFLRTGQPEKVPEKVMDESAKKEKTILKKPEIEEDISKQADEKGDSKLKWDEDDEVLFPEKSKKSPFAISLIILLAVGVLSVGVYFAYQKLVVEKTSGDKHARIMKQPIKKEPIPKIIEEDLEFPDEDMAASEPSEKKAGKIKAKLIQKPVRKEPVRTPEKPASRIPVIKSNPSPPAPKFLPAAKPEVEASKPEPPVPQKESADAEFDDPDFVLGAEEEDEDFVPASKITPTPSTPASSSPQAISPQASPPPSAPRIKPEAVSDPSPEQPIIQDGAKGIIFLSTSPPKTEVWFKGKKIGTTNITMLTLPVGENTVTFKKDDLIIDKILDIKEGKNRSLFFKLK